jgi:hypothetical protein
MEDMINEQKYVQQHQQQQNNDSESDQDFL